MATNNFEQIQMQSIAHEQFMSRTKLYNTMFYSSTISGGIIALLTGIGFVEINLMNVFLYFVFLLIPPAIIGIGMLLYLLPMIPIKPKRDDIFLGIDYIWIVKEQSKPTTVRYKIRRVILYTSNIMGSILIIGNIIFFLIELSI